MRLALAQINPVVGDLEGNRRLILSRVEQAKAQGADLVLLPELAVTGYPPEDLLLRPGFVRAAESSVEEIAREARGTTVLVGAPHFVRDLYNACYVLSGGEVKAIYRKRSRPRSDPAGARQNARRTDGVRGHVAAGPACNRPRARRRRAAGEHLRLAVPRRPRPRARADV